MNMGPMPPDYGPTIVTGLVLSVMFTAIVVASAKMIFQMACDVCVWFLLL